MISSKAAATANRDQGKLRNQLFLSSALLSSLILIVSAMVINNQFVAQVRAHVQAEVETLLPVYDAVWSEQARRLADQGTQLANSPIVKTVLADPRAAQDPQTLHEMIVDALSGPDGESSLGDLLLITDGAGQIVYAELHEKHSLNIRELPAARTAGDLQKQQASFVILGDRLFQLVLTPIVLHSGSAEVNNTLGVIGMGVEFDHNGAMALKQRLHSEVAFFVGDRLHSSSFQAGPEMAAVQAIASADFSRADPTNPVEVNIAGDLYLAFPRQLSDFEGTQMGQVFLMRSLAGAGQMLRAISNRLVILWTLALLTAWLLSYLVAGRITRPIESLVVTARELGKGNYDFPLPAGASGEIGQLAQAFDQMRDSLRATQAALLRNERLATIGQMASSIIHDLRNPLATITTAAEVLRNDSISRHRRQTMIETQVRASNRMSAMLTEVLEFSRGNYKLYREVQPLRSIVEQVALEFNAQFSHLDVDLVTQIPHDILVNADAERMERVLANMLVNAVQAMSAGGQIEISATLTGSVALMHVIDDGPGIPEDIRERLFEPFISHGKEGGTGLGLAIARGIIEAHGGKIALSDTPGRGAHFLIEFPAESSDPLRFSAKGVYAKESLTGG